MNYRGVFFLLGRLLMALAIALLIPVAVALAMDREAIAAFVISSAIAGGLGLYAEWAFRQRGQFRFGRREAILLVTSAWGIASIIGALPYVFTLGANHWIDALFESASGFTTTGASVLADPSSQPAAILLWRSLTQWLGGMGIIVLGIAVLPRLAVGGMELLGAEAPGPMAEKLTPRIAQTGKALWGIYALFTAIEAGVLYALGMSAFDAANHAFATMATGGFSTQGASIGAYNSAAIEYVVTLFMVIAGVNFALHFKLLHGRVGAVFRDSELRLFLGILSLSTVLIAINLMWVGGSRLVDAVRLSSFQVATMVTTTGFTTDDFDAWPAFSRALLFALMFIGGCAGSTGGSVKVVRVMIVSKKLLVEVKRFVQPNAVLPVRVGGRAVPDEVVASVTTFLIMFVSLFAMGGLALSAFGLDLVSALSASAACLGNIGPGFALVGPTQNFASMAGPAKLILIGLMIVGRLELYTVLVTIYLGRHLFRY